MNKDEQHYVISVSCNMVSDIMALEWDMFKGSQAKLSNGNTIKVDFVKCNKCSVAFIKKVCDYITAQLLCFKQSIESDDYSIIIDLLEMQRIFFADRESNYEYFQKEVSKALSVMCHLSWTGNENEKSRKKQKRYSVQFLQNYRIRKGKASITFSPDTISLLLNSFCVKIPSCLFASDNRRPNTYLIGRKILLHSSIQRNKTNGTDKTLTVKILLDMMTEVPSIGNLREMHQYNWKEKIKTPFENTLNDLIELHIINNWEYRSQKSKIYCSPSDLMVEMFEEYEKLRIVWE